MTSSGLGGLSFQPSSGEQDGRIGPGRGWDDPDKYLVTPQGELPLSAIHINLEEKEKEIRSFLIEGRVLPGIYPLLDRASGRGMRLVDASTLCSVG